MKAFERVTEKAGLPAWVNANAAVWLDYDRDGQLDLFIAGYWRDDVDLWNLKTTRGDARVVRVRRERRAEVPAAQPRRRHVRGRDGEGAASRAPAGRSASPPPTCAAPATPTSCWPTTTASPSSSPTRADGSSRRSGTRPGIGVAPKSGMNASFGDVLNQGQLAIYVSNISEPGNLVQGNNLWVPAGTTPKGRPRYLNQAGRAERRPRRLELGGEVRRPEQRRPARPVPHQRLRLRRQERELLVRLRQDRRRAEGAHPRRRSTGRRSATRASSGYQTKCLWLNKGGDFVDVAAAVGVERHVRRPRRRPGRPVQPRRARRGRRQPERAAAGLQEHRGAGPRLGAVRADRRAGRAARRGGATAAPSGRGAADVAAGRRPARQEQVQVVTAGNGYASQNMRRLHFGLGEDAKIEQGGHQVAVGPNADDRGTRGRERHSSRSRNPDHDARSTATPAPPAARRRPPADRDLRGRRHRASWSAAYYLVRDPLGEWVAGDRRPRGPGHAAGDRRWRSCSSALLGRVAASDRCASRSCTRRCSSP